MLTSIPTVVLVDDDPVDRLLISKLLKSLERRINLIELTDGQELLDYSDEHPLDEVALIIMDMKMPRLNGVETLIELKRYHPEGATPIVLLSSSSDAQDISNAYDAGAQAYVTKPIDPLAFKDAVTGMGKFWLDYNELPYVA